MRYKKIGAPRNGTPKKWIQERSFVRLRRTQDDGWQLVLRLGGVFGREDADETAHAAFVFEVYDAGDEREKSVVFAAADVEAGLALGAALAEEDSAGVDELAAETLGAEALTLGVAPVGR